MELNAKNNEEKRLGYVKLIKEAEAYLEEEGILKEESIGNLYEIPDAIPYMQLRYAYFRHLINLGKLKKAIEEGEAIIALSKADDLAIRHSLISLYAMIEDEMGASRIIHQFNDGSIRTLLPLTALYYKLDNYSKATEYLYRIVQIIGDFNELFDTMNNMDDKYIAAVDKSYQIGTIEEALHAIIRDNYLYANCLGLFDWMKESLNKGKKK